MEKIRIKNRMKKKCLINEYKTKISKIQKLQNNNINEIRKLEIKKKIDEENIIKVEKMCSNININDSFSTKSRTDKRKKGNSLTKTRLENSSDRSDYLISENKETSHQAFFVLGKLETTRLVEVTEYEVTKKTLQEYSINNKQQLNIEQINKLI